MNIKSGSPAQKFLARHKEFLRHWADGLHALEIAQRMGSHQHSLPNIV